MTYVVGLDLSLTGTGVARVTNGPEGGYEPWVMHRRMSTDTAGQDIAARARRLRLMAAEVVALCETADLVLVEAPAQSSRTGSAHDRAGLWWLIVERIARLGIPVAEVSPQHLWMYATGVGKGGKDAVLAAVVRRYGDLAPDLATNDEADALVLAALAWHRVTGTPLVSLPQTHTRTLDRIRWPSTTTERGHRA